jgi:glycosyltransferase involved in cell wall biosynthesis
VKILNDDGRVKKLRSLQQLARWFSERRIQVVHTHNTFAQFYGAMAAKLAGVPIVVNTQHGAGCGKNWRAEWQFRLANRLTRRIVGVSEDSTRRCQQQDGGSRHKMTTIWNGINLDRFPYHGPKLEPTAICVARLSPLKDFPTLLRATELVRRQVPDFRLRIVGDGPERAKLELLISELGIERHVELLGERQEVSQLLANSGFFVSASLSEGVSLTLLEAMAVGLPVLTTRVGGNPEVVLDGQTGRLVAPGSPSELADAMVTMCHEQDLWATMGLLGRQRVEQHFEIRNMIRAYESLYRELLQKADVLI